jgi:tRNA modification GTPase
MSETHTNPATTTITVETSPGQGGLALLILKGPHASTILHQCTRSNRLPIPGKIGQLRLMTLGAGTDEILDEVLIALVEQKPHQSCYEIGVHGGPAVVEEVLGLFQNLGATHKEQSTLAGLGPSVPEATLIAEALQLLPKAQSAAPSRVLLMALGGQLSSHIRDIQTAIQESNPAPAIKRLQALHDSYSWADKLFSPPTLALLGPPNAGKSTLFNALLGESRVITSDLPGTTRDYIEEWAIIDDFPITVTDTAGLRKTNDLIEEQGIKLGLENSRNADLRLLLIDPKDSTPIDQSLIPQNCLRIFTKIDLLSPQSLLDLKKLNPKALFLSALTGSGFPALRAALKEQLYPGSPALPVTPVIFTPRQKDLLSQTLTAMKNDDPNQAGFHLNEFLHGN